MMRGALSVAHRLKISPLLAGLIIVGFGTSMPELVVSLNAAQAGQPDIAIGNVVGSNIGNILLILGLCAVITPLRVSQVALRRDAVAVVAGSAIFVLIARDVVSRIDGAALLLLLVIYVTWTYRQDRRSTEPAINVHAAEGDALQRVPKSMNVSVVAVVVGLALLIVGAGLLIAGATGLAKSLGASEAVIGLTVVALGTSLPELTVSVTAAIRKQGDIAVGNVLGSNIFNVLGILGLSALWNPLEVSARIMAVDQWIMLGVAGVLWVLLATHRQLGRVEGGALVLAYGVYVTTSFLAA